MTSNKKPFSRAEAERLYTEYHRIIEIGAYSESPPEDYEDEWENDGAYWYGDVNLDEALARLEASADAEDLKFVRQENKTYTLVPLTESEKKERAERIDALRQASIAAQFQWQDEHKIVLNWSSLVLGKLPGEHPAYVVEIAAEICEDGPALSYSWPASKMLTVSWSPDGVPIVERSTGEQLALV